MISRPVNSHLVTEAAMRPASSLRQCFYCGRGIGMVHGDDCVLLKRRVRVRATIEYIVDAPAAWAKEMIEFHRNDSSWCATNMIPELQALDDANGCLCNVGARYEVLEMHPDVVRDEG